MNRIDRVTAILIHLQSRRVVKAQDIAERFEISLRTVYRDIRTLEEAGIPLLGEAGVGYSIMDGYRLPPVMFTKEEATAFLTAEKLIEKLTDTSTEESYKSAMYKIKSVLNASEKNYLEKIEERIEVLENPYIKRAPSASNPLQHILKGISDKRVLSIHYFANHSQETTQRNIEPVGVFYLGSNWHLIAFCQLRKDYRHFRLDRISKISRTDYQYEEHPSLKSFLRKMSKEQELFTVVMSINQDVVKYLGDQKFYNGYVSERKVKDKVEMTFITASIEGFARWYMMFGDCAEILSPERLRRRIKELSADISKKFK